MSMRKRITALLLSACLIFLSFPLVISAAEIKGTIGDNISWTLDASTGVLTITGTGAMDSRYTRSFTSNHPWYSEHRNKIRKVYIGEGITSVSENCFYECDNLTYVSFPSTLDTLESSSFVGCSNLNSVDLPASLKYYNSDAFRNTWSTFRVNVTDIRHWLSIEFKSAPPSVRINGSSLKNLVIPEGITEIKDYAFTYNKDIETVVIPDSVESIGRFAFERCSSLKSVTLGSGIKTIGSSCFSSCDALKDVYIKDASAFANIDFKVQSSNPLYLADNLYLNGVLLTDLVVSGEGKKISKYAFQGYDKLKSVNAGEGITAIDNYAFYECMNLEYVTLSDTVESLGDYVFANCLRLRHPTFGTGLRRIGTYAFMYCSVYLTELHLPEGLEELADTPFASNNHLTDVYLPSTLKKVNGRLCGPWEGIAFHISDVSTWLNIEFSNKFTHDVSSRTLLYVNGEPLKELVVPEDITVIPAYSFKNYTALEKVVFHDNVIEIGAQAFADCTNLKGLELPRHLEKTGGSAFLNCSSITELELPYTMKSIGTYTFGGCSNLRRVVIHEGLKTINEGAFSGCISLTKITIPQTVNYIKDSAFNRCFSLETINFSGSEYRWKTVTVVDDSYSNADLRYATVVYDYEIPITVSLYGDANDDSVVNAMDSYLMKLLLAGIQLKNSMPASIMNRVMDINGDGAINGADANMLKKVISGVC